MWGTNGQRPAWGAVRTEFGVDLLDAIQTAEGPYAVGTGGTLVADRGYGWEVVFADGPATREGQLRAVDATDDGQRLWMVGADGVLSCYDVAERKKFDYSYPQGERRRWTALAVSGEHGSEKLLVADAAGGVLPFTVDGFDAEWGDISRPVSEGAGVAALASTPDGVGFLVDTAGRSFRTNEQAGWQPAGIVESDVTFTDCYAGPDQRVYVTATNGCVYRYDDSRRNWAPIGVTGGTPLRALDVYMGEDEPNSMVVLGDDGTLYHRIGTERWEAVPVPTDSDLRGVSLGRPDVAVGGSGAVVERPRTATDAPDGAVADPYREDAQENGGDADEDRDATDRNPDEAGSGDDSRAAVLLLLAEQAGLGADELLTTVQERVPVVDDVPDVEEALADIAEEAGADIETVREALGEQTA